LPNDSPFASE